MARGLVISAIIGIILGFVASKIQFLQWMTIIPWGVAALVIGYLSKNKKESINNGLIYGFLLGFVFMLGVYQGSAPIITRIPFFAIIGLVSAICATILSFFGSLFKKVKK